MDKDTKKMINMASAIAEFTNTKIDRIDLQRVCHRSGEWYFLYLWLSDGRKITIRQDCTYYLNE